MTPNFRRVLFVLVSLWAYAGLASGQPGPVIVVETTRGSFAFETYPNEAPSTVAHVLQLVRDGFYDGQRFHRALPGFVIQWGDPQTVDPSTEHDWGRGNAAGSGTPIGVAEIGKKRTHTKGAVAMAHPGDPAKADSQIYVTLADRPDLDGRYTVFGHVIAGADVPARIQRGDLITRMYIRD
ncbi:MAG TPA: peptidylprolyl isomerase [Vicinamibacterales bacterium]|nr:peptidylprolyl isomerase [Vicinamibacterales bacterium]